MDPPPLRLVEFFPTYSVYAYAALAGTPMSNLIIEHASLPNTVIGELPQLYAGCNIIPPLQILHYLAKHVTDLDAGASNIIRAQITAFASLIHHDLKCAVDIARFADDEHFSRITHVRIMKRVPFPMNRFEAWKLRRDIMQRVRLVLGLPDAYEAMKWAQNTVSRVLDILSKRLGDENWILGTRGPTSLDCLVFGALADVQDNPLFAPGSSLAMDFPLLDAYYRRIAQKVSKSHFFSIGQPDETSFGMPMLVLSSSPQTRPIATETTTTVPPSAFTRSSSNTTEQHQAQQQQPQSLLAVARDSRRFLTFGVASTLLYAFMVMIRDH